MKKILLMALVLTSAYTLKAQILTPVKWAYASKKLKDGSAVILIKASIDKGWHIYSQTVKDGGPVKTSFKFSPDAAYLPVGITAAPKPASRYEKAFDMQVEFYENSVVFQQRVKLNKPAALVKGTIQYMACSDRQCLPPEDLDFEISLK